MAKGRKRKTGTRTKSGQLSRAGVIPFDRGTERVQAMRERFGEDYSTAIGRAYATGLLGIGDEAKARYDIARKFASLSRRMMGGDRYRCALDTSPRGNVVELCRDRDSEEWDWLIAAGKRADLSGGRPFMDQLLSREFTDHGPPWLERILAVRKGDRRDTIVLDAAVKAIDAIDTSERRERIRA